MKVWHLAVVLGIVFTAIALAVIVPVLQSAKGSGEIGKAVDAVVGPARAADYYANAHKSTLPTFKNSADAFAAIQQYLKDYEWTIPVGDFVWNTRMSGKTFQEIDFGEWLLYVRHPRGLDRDMVAYPDGHAKLVSDTELQSILKTKQKK